MSTCSPVAVDLGGGQNAGDDVAHTDLASFAAEAVAGDEDLLPGGLDGDPEALD